MTQNSYHKPFLMKRLHSIMGVGLVIFLIEHMLTNSEAALFFDADGKGFVKMVNFIHSLPYLPFIEMALIGIPFLIHAVLGIKYLLTSEINSFPSDGSKVSLGNYLRNHRFTWQRISSWVLVFAVLAHVVQMRFMEIPQKVRLDHEREYFMVDLKMDDGLYTVASRLGATLFDLSKIRNQEGVLREKKEEFSKMPTPDFRKATHTYEKEKEQYKLFEQELKLREKWVFALKQYQQKKPNKIVVVTKSMGSAFLLKIRDIFKDPMMRIIYSLFVIFACFHACNGLWTAFISWGISLTQSSQRFVSYAMVALMCLLITLGFASIWGTYLITLRY